MNTMDDTDLIIRELDNINMHNINFYHLFKYFKYNNTELNKKILNCLFVMIISVDNESEIFKNLYEPFVVSNYCIKNLSMYFLQNFEMKKPNILIAKILVILLNICRKSNLLSVRTMEDNNLQVILRLFVNCTEIFKDTVDSLNWTDVEKNIFLIVWRSLPCLFTNLIVGKTEINDRLSATCRLIFIQALKFSKLFISGVPKLNGWNNDIHTYVFDYINNVLEDSQYMTVFEEEKAIHTYIQWLRGTDTYLTDYSYSGYVLKIINTYITKLPEEAASLLISLDLFRYLRKNERNHCRDVYHEVKYCGIGDICQMLKHLLYNSRIAFVSFPFEIEMIGFLKIILKHCDEDCNSKIQAYELMLTLNSIFGNPGKDKQSTVTANEIVEHLTLLVKEQLYIIGNMRRCFNDYVNGVNLNGDETDSTASSPSESPYRNYFDDEFSTSSLYSPSDRDKSVDEDLQSSEEDDAMSYSSPDYNSSDYEEMKNQENEEEVNISQDDRPVVGRHEVFLDKKEDMDISTPSEDENGSSSSSSMDYLPRFQFAQHCNEEE